jgi:translation initiation factor 2D
MLPGVIVKGEINLYTFKMVSKYELCSICLNDNEAPVAIGRTLMSGEDMYMSGMKGRGFTILHLYQDKLWSMGNETIPLPLIISSPSNEAKGEIVSEKTEEEEEIIKSIETNLQLNKEIEEEEKEEEEEEEEEVETDWDQLLQDAFLFTLKYKKKEFKLPIIVSTFMKIMYSACPTYINLDIKKTKYKKMNNFLKEMDTIVKVKELQKGVISITEINDENESLKYFKTPNWMTMTNQKDQVDKKQDALEQQDTIANKVDGKLFVYEVKEFYKIDGNKEGFFKPTYK